MQTIPSSEHMRALRQRQEQLEAHIRRCRAAAGESDAPNPPLGRELDDARAVLAKVRAELARFAPR